MSYITELDTDTKTFVEMKLFTRVKNMKQLIQKVKEGTLNCALIKPTLILDPFQLVVAANKAVLADKTTTKSIYTEILYNLSISKNITQSLEKFGVGPNDIEALVVVLKKQNEESSGVFKEVDGHQCNFNELCKFTNYEEVKKAYKVGDTENEYVDLLDSVVSRIATKEFSN